MKINPKFLIIPFLLFCVSKLQAQVKIGSNPSTISTNVNLEVEASNGLKTVITKDSGSVGIGTNTPNINALLEVNATNKGLLLPRVALKATNNAAPITVHVAGMVVYNTATAGSGTTAVVPGYYYNDGTQWNQLLSVGNSPGVPTTTRSYVTAFQSKAHNTWVDVTGSTVTVPAGNSILGYNATVEMDNNGQGSMTMHLRFFDVTNGVAVANSERTLVSAGYAVGVNVRVAASGAVDIPLTLASPTQYRLQIFKKTTDGTPNTNQDMYFTRGYIEYKN